MNESKLTSGGFIKGYNTVFNIKSLNMTDKLIINYILSFDDCYASNATIANYYSISKRNVIRSISKLTNLGVVNKKLNNKPGIAHHILSINLDILFTLDTNKDKVVSNIVDTSTDVIEDTFNSDDNEVIDNSLEDELNSIEDNDELPAVIEVDNDELNEIITDFNNFKLFSLGINEDLREDYITNVFNKFNETGVELTKYNIAKYGYGIELMNN